MSGIDENSLLVQHQLGFRAGDPELTVDHDAVVGEPSRALVFLHSFGVVRQRGVSLLIELAIGAQRVGVEIAAKQRAVDRRCLVGNPVRHVTSGIRPIALEVSDDGFCAPLSHWLAVYGRVQRVAPVMTAFEPTGRCVVALDGQGSFLSGRFAEVNFDSLFEACLTVGGVIMDFKLRLQGRLQD